MIQSLRGHTPQIDPTAWVHETAVVIGQVQVGPHSSVWPTAVIRGDDSLIQIGANTSIQDGCVVHTTTDLSTTVVGDRVTVGHRAILHGCQVGNNSLVGMGSILLDNCKIGENVIVAAGTVIPMKKEIPDGVLVMGNPFRIKRDVTEKDLEWIEFSWKWYSDNIGRYETLSTES